MKNSYLAELASYYCGITADDMPPAVMARARRSLADFLCCLAVGSKQTGFVQIWNDFIAMQGGHAESTILGVGGKTTAMNAAAVMSVMGHATELDDGHRWGTAHPSVAVIPAALAVGEREKASLTDILVSVVIGYDIMLRSARAVNPAHLKRGFHTTGTCGCLGAAAACAYLLRLDFRQFCNAVSIGGLQSAGLQEMLHDGPGIKPLQAGKAAMGGVLAADLAKLGAHSPVRLYEGMHGWLKAMCANEYSETALVGRLGETWEIMSTYTKFYPSCRHCHAAIDLAREAKLRLQCSAEDVASVKIRTYEVGYMEVGHIVCPSNREQAMFSICFSVALALERGNVRLSDFDIVTLFDRRLRDLAKKISVVVDAKMNVRYPEERGAWMQVRLQDGRCLVNSTVLAKGEPESPVRDRDYLDKFGDMLSPYCSETFSQTLWNIIVGDGGVSSLQQVIALFERHIHEKQKT
jgi:2-methylcitrate dehydratase PrpD